MNNKLNISNRLKTIGDFVDFNDNVIDVGCDHALLSIYIYLNKTHNIIASDINKNPLKEAEKNLKKYNLDGKIELRLSNGLEKFSSNEFDTIIISGMGGINIIDILSKDISKLSNTKKMIIQSNKDIPLLRKFISKLGFEISNEVLVKEHNIIYTIIVFVKSNKKIRYNKTDLLIGPILKNSNDKLLNELLTKELKKRIKKLRLIPNKYLFARLKIKSELRIFKKIK